MCNANHKRMTITVDEFNDLIKQTMLDHVQSISIQLAKKIISKRIVTEKKRLQQEKENTTSEYLDTSLELCTLDRNGKPFISQYLDTIQTLKDKYNELDQDLVALQVLCAEIKSMDKILSQQDLDISQQDLQRLIELLIDKVLIHETYVRVDLFLSVFAKEMNAS